MRCRGVRGRCARAAEEILRTALMMVNLETTGLLKSVRFPFRSARVSNFPSTRFPPRSHLPPRLRRASETSFGRWLQFCNADPANRNTAVRSALRQRREEREREKRETGAGRGRLQQVVKYERRVVRFKHHLCLSIKFTRLSFQRCASCHFASPISVSYSCSDSHPSSSHNYTLRSATRFVSFRSSRSIPRDRSNYLVSSFSLLRYLRMRPAVGTNFSAFSLAIARRYATPYELPAINVKTFAFTVPPGLPAKLATYHDPTHSLYALVEIHFRGILLRVRNECNVNGKT